MKKRCSTLRIITLGASFILLLPGCCGSRKNTLVRKISLAPHSSDESHTIDPVNRDDTPPVITVWIHGTRFFAPSVFHEAFGGKAGLKLVSEIEREYSVHTTTDTICASAPDRCPKESMYIFGWSGKLSFEAREKAAKVLYNELKTVLQEYHKKYCINPQVRIIAHSHGGNVTLNLAKVKPENDTDFFISELILLACPVQTRTAHLIKDPIFKRIYSLYSQLDLVQVLDPQGLYWHYPGEFIFSQRCFPAQNKCAQIKIKFNGRALLHTEFVRPRFLQHVFKIVDEVDQWQKEEAYLSPSWKQMNKLLCFYTNGRKIKPEQYAKENIRKLAMRDQRTEYAQA